MDIPFFLSLSLSLSLSFSSLFYPLVFPSFSSRPRLFFFFFVFSLSRVRLGEGETNGESKNAGTKGGQQRNTRDSFGLTVGTRLARSLRVAGKLNSNKARRNGYGKKWATVVVRRGTMGMEGVATTANRG